jgi:L-2-hydroxyglutarate oxidase LhgO
MDRFDVTIIGAGVVGLAVAEEISRRCRRVLLLERHDGFGKETSSRNSEVIHAGIYYPPGSMKAVFCREGNRLLYETCTKRDIPHRRLGKIIVANGPAEIGELPELMRRAEENGADDLRFLSRRELSKMEPDVHADEALFSPSTGIVDSHRLMRSFFLQAEENGFMAAFRSEADRIHFDGKRYVVEIAGTDYRLETDFLINSAGLRADALAAGIGIDIDRAGYRIKYCKGSYFRAVPSPALQHLVYPVPTAHREGLGIHATLDLAGAARFGPDVEYVTGPEYSVDGSRRDAFHASVSRYLPSLPREALFPDMCGIRPKLQGPGEPVRDFVVSEESHRGFPGLINLIGIESPGLTGCIAIARHVARIIS